MGDVVYDVVYDVDNVGDVGDVGCDVGGECCAAVLCLVQRSPIGSFCAKIATIRLRRSLLQYRRDFPPTLTKPLSPP